MSTQKDFDGFYFYPSDQEDEMKYGFFKFNNDALGKDIEGTDLGHMYHVVLFKVDDEEEIVMDDCFEAIFSDPIEYSKRLAEMNMTGTFLKKKEKSLDWWDDYLRSVIRRSGVEKLQGYAKEIANFE